MHQLHLGRVVSFDVDAGLGEVETDGGDHFAFHCTAIAGGSRRIEPGARVAFRVGPGGPGRWEAAEVTPAGWNDPPGGRQRRAAAADGTACST